MQIDRLATALPGCFELRPRVLGDVRGSFVKTFHRDTFLAHGLCVDWAEQFYTHSKKGVLRGLHFQLPPAEHAKLVYCTAGTVLDVAVDLRRGSPAYGEHFLLRIDARDGNMLYLPAGLAHGFYVLSDEATLVYNVSSTHSPTNDSGIRWDSARIRWPDPAPIVSERDQALAPLAEFDSPFRFKPQQGWRVEY